MMPVPSPEELYELYKTVDTDTFQFELQREVIEEGRSFSAQAMEEFTNSVTLFIGARIMRSWEDRNEPPSVAKVTVTVEVG